jgi:hypothetical protein
MSNFFDEQGRTRVYDEAYCSYAEEVSPRRTQLIGKRAISGWKLFNTRPQHQTGLLGRGKEKDHDNIGKARRNVQGREYYPPGVSGKGICIGNCGCHVSSDFRI